MKTITKTIPNQLLFPMNPGKPEEMDRKYSFMHNLLGDKPNIKYTPDPSGSGEIWVMMMGLSEHMDDLKNAIYYGGILGRMFCTSHPDKAPKLSKILITNMIKNGGVEGADPEDGILKVIWPNKNIQYRDAKGNWQKTEPDIEMAYIDTKIIADPHGSPAAQCAYLWHRGDPEKIDDEALKQQFQKDLAEGDDVEMDDAKWRKKRLAVWAKLQYADPDILSDLTARMKL